MIVRSIDLAGDWNFGKGFNSFVSNQAAVAQNITTRLRAFLGDCFFDVDAGIDWFTLLGGKNQLALELSLSAVIVNTRDVTFLNQISVTVDDTRKVTLQYEVQTAYSRTLQGEFTLFVPLVQG